MQVKSFYNLQIWLPIFTKNQFITKSILFFFEVVNSKITVDRYFKFSPNEYRPFFIQENIFKIH